MAIAPIDLQTLFTQVDKVGRTQIAEKEGQALHQTMQGVHLQKKADEQILQVNDVQNSGEGAEKVNDHNKGQSGGGNQKKKQKEAPEEESQVVILRDLSLGNTIDISL